MSGKLRVFISSTMRDLANERDAVVRALAALNFEPVNAEGWLPDGRGSWERISLEIESSHLFVLLLGDEYGWVPPEGPGAAERRSVTHMEALRAVELDLPIFPFLKRLRYDDPLRDTPKGKLRDDFRTEVRGWKGGRITTEFDLAADLAPRVQAAVVSVLSDTFVRAQVRERAPSVRAMEAPPADTGLPVQVPEPLVREVQERRVVLIGGAGMSLAAGYPSARAMRQVLQARMGEHMGIKPGSVPLGTPLSELASIFEMVLGRAALVETIQQALAVPQGVEPTYAHREAVRLFGQIITTNFDTLFEDAAAAQGISYVRSTSNDVPDSTWDSAWRRRGGARSDRVQVMKLAGSLHDPATLRITEADLQVAVDSDEFILAGQMLRENAPLIVGSSLRGVQLRTLLQRRNPDRVGYVVAPNLDPFERSRLRWLGLEPIDASAANFFRALANAV